MGCAIGAENTEAYTKRRGWSVRQAQRDSGTDRGVWSIQASRDTRKIRLRKPVRGVHQIETEPRRSRRIGARDDHVFIVVCRQGLGNGTARSGPNVSNVCFEGG